MCDEREVIGTKRVGVAGQAPGGGVHAALRGTRRGRRWAIQEEVAEEGDGIAQVDPSVPVRVQGRQAARPEIRGEEIEQTEDAVGEVHPAIDVGVPSQELGLPERDRPILGNSTAQGEPGKGDGETEA